MAKTASDLVAEAKAAVQTCSVAEAAQEIKAGAMLLDVREPAEFEAGAIRGAVNLPRGLLEAKIAEVCGDPSQRIVIHCASGGRAALATQTLGVMGYQNVVSVDGAYGDLAKACS